MAKLKPKFIEAFFVIDGYAYTGTETPANHEKSNLFFNNSTGSYAIFENDAWGTAISAEGKTFLSANENKIYSVLDGNITFEQPSNFSFYFAINNRKLYCCYDNNIISVSE